MKKIKNIKTVKNYYLLMTFIALAFTGCSSNDDTSAPDVQVPIKLNSSVHLLRSSLQNTQIVAGQEVGFYLNITNESDYEIANEKLTADGLGNFAHATMFYPTEGSSFVFSAYQPYSTIGLVDGNVNFSVKVDQSDQSDYLNSDLLYVRKLGVVRTTAAVPLVFDHKLSRMTFKVIKGGGAEISSLSKIEILNVRPSVSMRITDGILSEATGEATTINAFAVTGGALGVESLSGSAAIIIPQVIATGTKLLAITIGEVTYTYTTTEPLSFDGGKSYDFQIKVDMAGITVTSTINDWINGGSIQGEGTIE